MEQAQRHQQQINLESVFEALERPLALIKDPDSRDEMRRFIEAARVYQERAIVDVLSEISGAVNAAATDTRVRLEYESKQLVLVVEANSGGEEATGTLARMDGDLEKVTIRLPARLKQSIDQVAGARGVSLNTWYVWALARSVYHQMRRGPLGDAPAPWSGGRRGRRGHGRFGGAAPAQAD